MRGAAKLATVLVLVLSLGLHWAVLQTVAWTGMLIRYSRDASLQEALQKTFDGRHPCCLCKQIAAGKKAEKKPQFRWEVKKQDLLSATTRFCFAAPTHFWWSVAAEGIPHSISLAPPTPPPRADFA